MDFSTAEFLSFSDDDDFFDFVVSLAQLAFWLELPNVTCCVTKLEYSWLTRAEISLESVLKLLRLELQLAVSRVVLTPSPICVTPSPSDVSSELSELLDIGLLFK